VIIWNFDYLTANRIEDVLAGTIISFVSFGLKKYLKI